MDVCKCNVLRVDAFPVAENEKLEFYHWQVQNADTRDKRETPSRIQNVNVFSQ